MKLFLILISVYCFAFTKSFASASPTNPAQGRQVYNIANIKNTAKEDEKEKSKQESIESEKL